VAHRIPAPAKHGKATIAASCTALGQIPNIGVSLAADLRSIGIVEPHDLIGRDPYGLFVALCERSGQRQDPCVLDSFMAATDFMEGAAPSPWWHYTARRKAVYGQLGVPETGLDEAAQAIRPAPSQAASKVRGPSTVRGGRTP
jgi:hypothetical protein